MHSGNRQARGGVIAIVLAILAVLGLLMAGAVLCLVHNLRVEKSVSQSGKTVVIRTSMGSIRLHERAPADARRVWLPVYPGAALTARPGKMVDVQLDFGGSQKHFDVAAIEYSTHDSAGQVIEFYRKEFPTWSVISHHDGSVELKLSERGYKRFISIREAHGSTRFTLAQAGEGQVN
jgi:hypothetical protein